MKKGLITSRPESSLGAFWIAKYASCLHADNKASGLRRMT